MNDTPLWIFGYGSLMWEPGFAHDEKVIARLQGFARTFCMRSIHHRGTPDNPGLVLALDRSEMATCDGLALRVSDGREAETLEYLRERELISSAYLEKNLVVELADQRRVMAVTFVVDEDHVQYCGCVPLEEQASIIAAATGGRGPNAEYLFNTAGHLRHLGIQDGDLEWLAERVRMIKESENE